MPENDRKWAREWNACRNCEATRRPHEARGYCAYCYRLIRKLAKICSWTQKDFRNLAWSSPQFLNNNIEQIKEACKTQINAHLRRVHAIEKKLQSPISGMDIEYQLGRIARRMTPSLRSKNNYSLYHGIADYIDGNFDSRQRQILYRLLNKMEDQARRTGINWNAIWKKFRE
jgi:hypothetical protein